MKKRSKKEKTGAVLFGCGVTMTLLAGCAIEGPAILLVILLMAIGALVAYSGWLLMGKPHRHVDMVAKKIVCLDLDDEKRQENRENTFREWKVINIKEAYDYYDYTA